MRTKQTLRRPSECVEPGKPFRICARCVCLRSAAPRRPGRSGEVADQLHLWRRAGDVERPQLDAVPPAVSGARNPPLGLSSLSRSPERVTPEVCKHGQLQPEQRRELLNVSAASGSLPEFRFGEISHLQTDHDRWRSAEPPTRRRTRDTKSVAMVRSPLRWTSSGADGQSVAGGGTWSSLR
jgi:hypothetical protein